MTDAPAQELLTSGEVAKRFRVSVSSVRRWAAAGRIPSFRTPTGQHRYRAADVARIIGQTELEPEAYAHKIVTWESADGQPTEVQPTEVQPTQTEAEAALTYALLAAP